MMLGGSSGSGGTPSSWGAGGGRTPVGATSCSAPGAFCTTLLCLRGGVVGGAPAATGSTCSSGVWVDRLEATFSGMGTATSLAGAAPVSTGSKERCEPGGDKLGVGYKWHLISQSPGGKMPWHSRIPKAPRRPQVVPWPPHAHGTGLAHLLPQDAPLLRGCCRVPAQPC